MTEDIRWKQRFNNFVRAFRRLDDCCPIEAEPAIYLSLKTGAYTGF